MEASRRGADIGGRQPEQRRRAQAARLGFRVAVRAGTGVHRGSGESGRGETREFHRSTMVADAAGTGGCSCRRRRRRPRHRRGEEERRARARSGWVRERGGVLTVDQVWAIFQFSPYTPSVPQKMSRRYLFKTTLVKFPTNPELLASSSPIPPPPPCGPARLLSLL
jgi:hypothetical protein